jgi:hypothetical protein
VFSEYVRRRHADHDGYVRCYTSGVVAHWTELQCGHAIGGRNNAVLFDDEICRPQTVAENVFKRGNYPVFTAKLIREHGLEWFEAKLIGARKAVKLMRSDLEEIIEKYKQKLVELDAPKEEPKKLTLDCMTCKSWPEVCQKCYERRK